MTTPEQMLIGQVETSCDDLDTWHAYMEAQCEAIFAPVRHSLLDSFCDIMYFYGLYDHRDGDIFYAPEIDPMENVI